MDVLITLKNKIYTLKTVAVIPPNRPIVTFLDVNIMQALLLG
jgi:hypothetical protein